MRERPEPVGSVPAGLDHYGRLTDPMGVRMAEFPLSPMFAKMLLESGSFGCSKEVVTIAAMMQIQNIFVVPSNQKKAAVSEKDNIKSCRVLLWAEKLCQLYFMVFLGFLAVPLGPRAQEICSCRGRPPDHAECVRGFH